MKGLTGKAHTPSPYSKGGSAWQHPQNLHSHGHNQGTPQPCPEVSLCTEAWWGLWSRVGDVHPASHTHKEKVVPVGLVQYAGILPYPGILTDAYSPVPRAVHEHLPVLFAGDRALGSPSSKILPCSTIQRRTEAVMFILQTSCIIEQPDVLTAYFITERKSYCGEMREYASQN